MLSLGFLNVCPIHFDWSFARLVVVMVVVMVVVVMVVVVVVYL